MMDSSPGQDNVQVNGIVGQDVDPMEDFSRQLENIINSYGPTSSLSEQILPLELEGEKAKEATNEEAPSAKGGGDASPGTVAGKRAEKKRLKGLGKEATQLMQSLGQLKSPEEKLEVVLQKHTELLEQERGECVQMRLMEQRQSVLLKQNQQLLEERCIAVTTRSRLEALCRALHQHSLTLREESQQRCREDEEKRKQITEHFQSTVEDIQAQIKQHSSRNDKLCHENSELSQRLTGIIEQYEQREESLEKIFKHRDLQQQVVEAKLEQANVLLREAEEKHKREKEYLLKEAIDKTRKCYTMKEQELEMKKQLVLYSQKFDEFQTTLAKSNDVYASFKQEMERMTKKMKKMEKESNVWKSRFESCNKTLLDMIEERSEKAREFELFTLKVAKLETLCRTMQEERKGLYMKIKEVKQLRFPNTAGPGPLPDPNPVEDVPPLPVVLDGPEAPSTVLTAEMERLRAEQLRLQEFAASLRVLGPAGDDEDSEEETSTVPGTPSQPEPLPDKSQVIREETSTVDGVNPEAVKPEAVKPEAVKPEAVKPEAVKPEAVKPEAVKPEGVKPEEDKTEAVKPEGDKTEAVKTEAVKPEGVKSEGVKSEGVKTEAVKPEGVKTEAVKFEGIKAEGVKAEGVKAEGVKAEGVKLEASPAGLSVPEPTKPEMDDKKSSKAKQESVQQESKAAPSAQHEAVQSDESQQALPPGPEPHPPVSSQASQVAAKTQDVKSETGRGDSATHQVAAAAGTDSAKLQVVQAQQVKGQEAKGQEGKGQEAKGQEAKGQGVKGQEAKAKGSKAPPRKQGSSKKKGGAKSTKKTS